MVDVEKGKKDNLIATYMHLTKEVLPSLARTDQTDWPVSQDHCFQRIVLDHVCGGVCSRTLGSPTYKHLTNKQAQLAVKIYNVLQMGRADLKRLNQQSLVCSAANEEH